MFNCRKIGQQMCRKRNRCCAEQMFRVSQACNFFLFWLRRNCLPHYKGWFEHRGCSDSSAACQNQQCARHRDTKHAFKAPSLACPSQNVGAHRHCLHGGGSRVGNVAIDAPPQLALCRLRTARLVGPDGEGAVVLHRAMIFLRWLGGRVLQLKLEESKIQKSPIKTWGSLDENAPFRGSWGP